MSWFGAWQAQCGGLGLYAAVHPWMSTLDFQALYYDPSVDPALPTYSGPAVFAFWHEYITCPFYLRPRSGTAMLLSRHRDAEWLGQTARLVGLEVVRGSTARGGEAAVRELLRLGRTKNVAVTPDGPRGPRRQVAAGCVYVASRLGLPFVALGIGYDRPWRLRTWDRFAWPRPYSRCRLVWGPRRDVPSDLDRDGIEHYRREFEALLNRLTGEAEAWAVSGERRAGQVPGFRRPAYRRWPGRVAACDTVQPETFRHRNAAAARREEFLHGTSVDGFPRSNGEAE